MFGGRGVGEGKGVLGLIRHYDLDTEVYHAYGVRYFDIIILIIRLALRWGLYENYFGKSLRNQVHKTRLRTHQPVHYIASDR